MVRARLQALIAALLLHALLVTPSALAVCVGVLREAAVCTGS
jgi:hypothetical protein